MALNLDKIKECTAEQIKTWGDVASASDGVEKKWTGANLKINLEAAIPLLLADEYIDDVCYKEEGETKTYHFSPAAWQHFNKQNNKYLGVAFDDPIKVLKYFTDKPWLYKANQPEGEEGPVGVPRSIYDSGDTSDIDIPVKAFGAEDEMVEVMKANPPRDIGSDYDTEEWTAVGCYLSPTFIAMLRAALNDTGNELFRKNGIEGVYFVTKKIDRTFYGYPEGVRNLSRIVDKLKEAKVWFEAEKNALMKEGVPEEKARSLETQRENMQVALDKFEVILRDANQAAAEKRNSWDISIQFGLIVTLMQAALGGIFKGIAYLRRKGEKSEIDNMRAKVEELDRQLREFKDPLESLRGGKAEPGMAGSYSLAELALDTSLEANRLREELRKAEEATKSAREAERILRKARETIRKGEKR